MSSLSMPHSKTLHPRMPVVRPAGFPPTTTSLMYHEPAPTLPPSRSRKAIRPVQVSGVFPTVSFGSDSAILQGASMTRKAARMLKPLPREVRIRIQENKETIAGKPLRHVWKVEGTRTPSPVGITVSITPSAHSRHVT